MSQPYDPSPLESGMIGDKEVVLHKLAKFTWAIDLIKHTSDDTTELVEGWILGDEYKALTLYDEKVEELLFNEDIDRGEKA